MKTEIMQKALEDITKVQEETPVKIYQRMEQIAKEALIKVKAIDQEK